MIVKDDVSILSLDEPMCEECGDAPARQRLALELRALGETVIIGAYCLECAVFQRDLLQATLPEDDEEFDEAAAVEAASDRRP